MGIGATVNMSTQMMNVISSIFSRGTNAASFISAVSGANVIGKIINFVAGFFYFVCKWFLFIVDVIFAYIQQLAGLNMGFGSMEELLSKDSDIVFNLLFSNSATLTVIVRSLIIIAILLIIIFSIFAVIKTQFDSVKNGKADSSLRVLKSTMKAIVLLILTPMLAIFGIIASNLILQSLYMATNTGQSTSLGTQIFLASSTTANNYRNYAKDGRRIPITYDFEKEQEIYDHYDQSVDEEFVEYLTSSNNAIYATYLTFTTDNFMTYKSLKDTNSSSENSMTSMYYTIYDKPSDGQLMAEGKLDDFIDYRRIENYAVEYFVMADVVDYAISSSNPLYFKTIEDTLNSIIDLYSVLPNGNNIVLTIFNNVVSKYNIKFLNSAGGEIVAGQGNTYKNYIEVFQSRECKIIRYSSTFAEPDNEGEPAVVTQIQYNHLMGETDELFGAKFIMAVENSINIDGVSYKYFEPLSSDYKGNSKFPFESAYHINGVVPAKGIFESCDYPTAIKKDVDNNINFYRERLVISVLGDSSQFASFDWSIGGGGFLSNMITMIRAIFNPASLVPNLDVDTDLSESIRNSYSEEYHVEKTIEAGRMHIGYMFNGGITSLLTNDLYNMSINNFYRLYSLNFLLLVVGSIILVGVCAKAVLALIQRAYDLFLIILIYPTACATIPLETVGVAGGYKNWVDTYTRKLFATYGIVLGINFVMMLFPVIQGINFFTPQSVAENKAIRRIGGLFFGFLSINQITNLLNSVVRILFELVAFTLLKTIPEVIGKIAGGETIDGDGVFGKIKNAFVNFTKTARLVIPTNLVMTVTRKAVEIGKKAKGLKDGGAKNFLTRLLPGSNIVETAKNKKFLHDKKKEQKSALDDLKESMMNGDSKDEIQKKMDAYKKAQKSYTEALGRAASDAGSEKGGHSLEQMRQGEKAAMMKEEKQDKKTGVSSREDDDLDENGVNEAYKSNRQLRKDKRKAKKYIKALKKIEKKSGELSEEQQKSMDTYTKLLDAAQAERESRKNYKKERAEIEELRRKGSLTQEELERINAFDAKSLLGDKKKRKQLNKAQKKNVKQMRKGKKAEQKRQEKEAKQERLFSRAKGKKRKQKRVLKKLEAQAADIQTRLNATGFKATFRDVSQMDPSRIQDIIKNPMKYGASADQVQMLKDYSGATTDADKKKFSDMLTKSGFNVAISDLSELSEQEMSTIMQNAAQFGVSDDQLSALNDYNQNAGRRDSLVGIHEQSKLNRAMSKARLKERRDKKVAGYGGINVFKRIKKKRLTKKSGTIDETQQELARVEQQLATLGNSSVNFRRTEALRKQKAQLEARISRMTNWGQINNKEFRTQYKKDRRYEKKASQYLKTIGEEVTPENIRKVVSAMQKKKQKKK